MTLASIIFHSLDADLLIGAAPGTEYEHCCPPFDCARLFRDRLKPQPTGREPLEISRFDEHLKDFIAPRAWSRTMCCQSRCDDNAPALRDPRYFSIFWPDKRFCLYPNSKSAMATLPEPASTANQYRFKTQNPSGKAKLIR
jgi:hypothetical protein